MKTTARKHDPKNTITISCSSGHKSRVDKCSPKIQDFKFQESKCFKLSGWDKIIENLIILKNR